MNIYCINDMPLWAEILVLIVGLLFFYMGYKFLKSGTSRGPFYMIYLRFQKEKNPVIYWFFVIIWLGVGLALLVFSIILLLPF